MAEILLWYLVYIIKEYKDRTVERIWIGLAFGLTFFQVSNQFIAVPETLQNFFEFVLEVVVV